MTELKNITAILTELDSLAAKADRFTAQRKANAATDDGRAAAINLNGVKCYKYTYSTAAEYQDANGAIYDTARRAWIA